MATKKKSEQTALAQAPAAALAAGPVDELADVLGDVDLETDGLEEIDQEDIKIAVKVFNMKGTDEAGDPIPKNRFYDTITEEVQKSLEGVLLTLHKTNEWREFDEGEGKSNVMCRSYDRITGTMHDGTERPCNGCPDAQWRTDDDGKRFRNCGPVYNFVGLERLTQQPFILRCKKTSLRPAQQYLSKHFIGRRIVGGKKKHYPLFAFETSVALKMADGGSANYAIPTFERGGVLPKEEIERYANEAKFFREKVMPLMAKATEADVSDDGARTGGDDTFNPNDFADDDGGGGGEATAAAGNRF